MWELRSQRGNLKDARMDILSSITTFGRKLFYKRLATRTILPALLIRTPLKMHAQAPIIHIPAPKDPPVFDLLSIYFYFISK